MARYEARAFGGRDHGSVIAMNSRITGCRFWAEDAVASGACEGYTIWHVAGEAERLVTAVTPRFVIESADA